MTALNKKNKFKKFSFDNTKLEKNLTIVQKKMHDHFKKEIEKTVRKRLKKLEGELDKSFIKIFDKFHQNAIKNLTSNLSNQLIKNIFPSNNEHSKSLGQTFAHLGNEIMRSIYRNS